MIFNDGSKYEGQFFNGMKHGVGIFKYQNRDIY